MSDNPLPTREEIEESIRICESSASAVIGKGLITFDAKENAAREARAVFHTHACQALPRRNAQCLSLLDQLAEKDREIERFSSGVIEAGKMLAEKDATIERYSAAIKGRCQCRFENGEQYEECHLHACQRHVRLENGDPSDVTLESEIERMKAREAKWVETVRAKAAFHGKRIKYEGVVGDADESRGGFDVAVEILHAMGVAEDES